MTPSTHAGRLLDLSLLGPNISVPFSVRKLARARVLWLNERWFLEAGIDILRQTVRRDIEAWLLDTYGVVAGRDADDGLEESTMFADRYGGSLGGRHGGSGRCAYVGDLNVKGLGPTPLVSSTQSWSYSHGFAWLGEALREAISAEIAAAELPQGAVTVVAIIDAGETFPRYRDGPDEPRALIVRANFVRPAHFERSIYFGEGGYKSSPQYLDAARVRDAVDAASGVIDLPTMFSDFARQIGAGRAHRLWQGRFLSSNVTVTGAMVDFGSFRAVPNWCALRGLPGENFGEDSLNLNIIAQSLSFYFGKYSRKKYNASDLVASCDKHINAAFIRACLDGVGLGDDVSDELRDELESAFWSYFKAQQDTVAAIETPAANRLPWLYGVLAEDPKASAHRPTEQAAALAIRKGLLAAVAAGSSLHSARLWLRPRPDLYYDVANILAEEVCKSICGDDIKDRNLVENYIRSQCASSRRYWPERPKNFDIIGFSSNTYSNVLFGRYGGDTRLYAIVEGRAAGENFLAFGQHHPREVLDRSGGAVAATIRAKFEIGAESLARGAEIELGTGRRLRLPPPAMLEPALVR